MDIKIIDRYWHIIKHIPGCSLQPLIGFRKKTSLKIILVKTDRAATLEIVHLPRGNFHCGRCTTCKQILEDTELSLPDLNINLHHNFFYKLLSSYAIYLIVCLCSKKYIGSISRKIRTRIAEHRSRIKNHKNHNVEAYLVQHFLEF